MSASARTTRQGHRRQPRRGNKRRYAVLFAAVLGVAIGLLLAFATPTSAENTLPQGNYTAPLGGVVLASAAAGGPVGTDITSIVMNVSSSEKIVAVLNWDQNTISLDSQLDGGSIAFSYNWVNDVESTSTSGVRSTVSAASDDGATRLTAKTGDDAVTFYVRWDTAMVHASVSTDEGSARLSADWLDNTASIRSSTGLAVSVAQSPAVAW